MTPEEPTPEAVDALKGLVHNLHPMEDSALLQLLFEGRLAMGSPAKVHITSLGVRVLAAPVARS